jgi:hypothetical protein
LTGAAFRTLQNVSYAPKAGLAATFSASLWIDFRASAI